MILHEAPSMETTTPKGEWFPCWVAEWSIMENMQQQMWFCFYPSPISINISIYAHASTDQTAVTWAPSLTRFFTAIGHFSMIFMHQEYLMDILSKYPNWFYHNLFYKNELDINVHGPNVQNMSKMKIAIFLLMIQSYILLDPMYTK